MTTTTKCKNLIRYHRFKYRTIELRSVKGIEHAERLQRYGWTIVASGVNTVQMQKAYSVVERINPWHPKWRKCSCLVCRKIEKKLLDSI